MNTEALKKQDFLPVLLGSDINVYGMARSFHEAYGYKSVAVGKGILPACTHSHIVEVLKVEPRLEEDDVFVRTLTEFAKAVEKCKELLRAEITARPLRRQLHQNACAQPDEAARHL